MNVDMRPETRPVQVFKMRELSQNTAQVMKRITESARPALITMRGRYVAMITPLTDGDLESKLITAAFERGVADTQEALTRRPPSSPDEVAAELGFEPVAEYDDPST